MNYKTLLLFIILVAPLSALAQGYVSLVSIPGVSDPTGGGFNDYINALYVLSISIAALLAVIKIIIAGVKWMLSDVVTSKQEAKSDIWGATIGLLVVISAVLVLNVINPQLIESDIVFTKPHEFQSQSPTFSKTRPALSPGDTETVMKLEDHQKCVHDIQGEWYVETDGLNNYQYWCIKKANKAFLNPEQFACNATTQTCDSNDKFACESNFNGIWEYPYITDMGTAQYYRAKCVY